MRVRARRFSPGLVLRGESGSEVSRLGAEDGGASAISAVSGGVGVVVAAIFVLLELFASKKSAHFLLLFRLKLINESVVIKYLYYIYSKIQQKNVKLMKEFVSFLF